MTAFYSTRLVKKSRKACNCDGCGHIMPAGSQIARTAGSYDGEFYSLAYHPDCQEAEIFINRENGFSGEEWMAIRAVEEREDKDSIAAHFPIVARRMGWKLVETEER